MSAHVGDDAHINGMNDAPIELIVLDQAYEDVIVTERIGRRSAPGHSSPLPTLSVFVHGYERSTDTCRRLARAQHRGRRRGGSRC